MKTRQLEDKKKKKNMPKFESVWQLICMGYCCTNHYVTIQDSPVVLLSRTDAHFPPETLGVLVETPITLCHRALTTPTKQACVYVTHCPHVPCILVPFTHSFVIMMSHSYASPCPCAVLGITPLATPQCDPLHHTLRPSDVSVCLSRRLSEVLV